MTPTIWAIIAGVAALLGINTPWLRLLQMLVGGRKPDLKVIEEIVNELIKDRLPAEPDDDNKPDTLVEKIVDRLRNRVAAQPSTEAAHTALHKLQDVIAEMFDHGDQDTASKLAALLPAVATTCCNPPA